MPLMTKPLAHIEMLLDKVTMYERNWRLELERLQARIHVVSEMQTELRTALEAEKQKLSDAAEEGSKERK